MTRRSLRSIGLTALQYGIAIVALAWLFTQVRLVEAISLLAEVDAPTAGALVVVTVAGLLARFYTWQVVIEGVAPVSLRAAASVDLVVNFLNQLLPSRLSGRVAAPFVLRGQTGMAYTDATAVSGVHTGVYAIYYGVAAAIGLGLAAGQLSTGIVFVLALSTALYGVAGAVVLLAGVNLTALDHLVRGVHAVASTLPRVGDRVASAVDSTFEFTADSSAAFRSLAVSPRLWVQYGVGWFLALVVAPGVRVLLLLGAFGVTVEPIFAFPLYLVAAYSVTLLPLTPGGIGVTEATATVVFVALGLPETVVVPVILVDRFLGVYLPAVAGWYPSLSFDLADVSTEE